MCKVLEKIKRLQQEEAGAAVIEVSVIVPIIFIVVMGCILFLFFLLDMGIMKSETMRLANEISVQWRQEKHDSLAMKKQELKERLNKRLTLAKLKKSEISISFGTVIVEADVTFFLSGKGLSFSSKSKASIGNREEWIRRICH